ncbi:MAG: hypothetical protein REH83_05265 [Rickettsiella sp.]|nr:hypothetical protein [Rickettsiella sp.]
MLKKRGTSQSLKSVDLEIGQNNLESSEATSLKSEITKKTNRLVDCCSRFFCIKRREQELTEVEVISYYPSKQPQNCS